MLFRADDVQQLVDRSLTELAVVARLEAAIAAHVRDIGAPEEQLTRLRLSPPG